MSKTLQSDTPYDVHTSRPEKPSQIFSAQIHKIYDLDLDEESLSHHLIKTNDATIWRWYLRERTHYPKIANQILTKITRQSKFIQHLRLNCFVQISDFSLQILQELSTLKSFNLSVPDSYKVTPTGLCHFIYGLAGLHSLENLDLCFVYCYYFTKEGFDIIIQGSESLKIYIFASQIPT